MAVNAKNVTEFSYFTLTRDVDALDASTDTGKAIALAVDTALKQPGARRSYVGAEIENPLNFWLFLDWESIEHHMNYQKSE